MKLHICSKLSRRVACPLACVQLISLFLYEKNQSKFTLKRINYDKFTKKIPGATINLIANK